MPCAISEAASCFASLSSFVMLLKRSSRFGLGAACSPQCDAALILCCDERDTLTYGKIMIVNTPRDGEKSRVWTDVTFVELLMLILRAAQTSMEQSECASDVAAAGSDEASRASGRGKWDVAWQPKHGTAKMLYEALLSRQLQPPGADK